MDNDINLKNIGLDGKTGKVIVVVDQETITAFDEFDALVNGEGTQALKDKWSHLRSKLREYLQITDGRLQAMGGSGGTGPTKWP